MPSASTLALNAPLLPGSTLFLTSANDIVPFPSHDRRERSLINKFFSGLYKIMGFKHTITTSTATSEFKLVKNAPSFKKEED